MNLHLRITLANDSGNEFFGRGLCELLEGIAERGSIQQAAKTMNLSYVKALHILSRLEQEVGFPLVVRHRGGASHGGAELTEVALSFLAAYRQLEHSVKAAGDEAFARFQRTCETQRIFMKKRLASGAGGD